MANYVYPALFHKNDDGSITVTYPDLPGCITEGKSLSDALFMAQEALTLWLEYTVEHNEDIPVPSDPTAIITAENEFANLVQATVKDGRAVRRTVSIPKWMDDKVVENGLSLSRILQDALRDRLSAN